VNHNSDLPYRDLAVGEAVFRVRELRPDAVATFEDFLTCLKVLVRGEELVMFSSDLLLYGLQEHWSVRALVEALGQRPYHWNYRSLVDTVGECSITSLTDLGVERRIDLPKPVLLGNKQAIRTVCSYSETADEDFIVESMPLWSDFSRFANLWREEKPPHDAGFRKYDKMRMGKAIGEFHEIPLIWSDLHPDQIGFNKDGAILYDIDDDSWAIYCKPSPAQCATMLVPLLQSFDGVDFEGFMQSYIAQRGDPGEHVLNLIEHGDRTGWMLPFNRGDYELASQRAQTQVTEDDESGLEPPTFLLSLLAMSYSRVGHHAQATQVAERALASVDADSSDRSQLLFNLGQAHYRAGNIEQAASEFGEVIQQERRQPSISGLLDAAITMLSHCDQE
jgi:hypothetical protein